MMLRMTFLFAFIGLALSAPAYAIGLKLEVLGNSTTVNGRSDSQAYTSQLGLGGGLEFSFPFGGNLSFDFGGLYVPRKYQTDVTSGATKGASIVSTQTALQVPVLLRWWLGRMFSIGVGGYYDKYVGDIKQSTTLAPGLKATTSALTYLDASQSTSDYGATAAIGFDFPLGVSSGLVIDGRYNLGLGNQVTTSSTVKFSDVQVLVGLRFGSNEMK